jgi:non-structural maintenance of chromosomes element 1
VCWSSKGYGKVQYDFAKANVKYSAVDDEVDISYDPNKFDQYINELNRQLEPLDLKLTATLDEVVGKKLWAMVCSTLTMICPSRGLSSYKVNTKEDELAQVATDYSPVEIAYFKALVRPLNPIFDAS